jgi:uncharacterized protein (TIGR03067 family)
MRGLTLLALFAGTALAADAPSDEAVKKELKLFQGAWKAVSIQNADGKPAPETDVMGTSLIVEKDRFSLTGAKIFVDGTFTVDPTKKVKTIDVFLKNLPKDKAILGIYEIKGDTRKSCFALPGQERPDGFSKDGGYVIIEWKRDK